ncbi:MAG: hypothetical protein ABI554_10440 [Flavobacterium sp.]
MKKLLLLIALLFGINSFGQDTNPLLTQAITDFKKLEIDFNPNNQELLKKEGELKVLLEEISKNQDSKLTNNLTTKLSEIQELRTKLNKTHQSYEAYKEYFIDKGLTTEQIDAIFKPEYKILDKLANSAKEPKVYQYYGKDLILEEIEPTGNKKTDDILKAVLSQKSEAYLGDIIIPKDLQEFRFYKPNKVMDSIILDTRYYRFKSISFEILDGFISDIKVFVLDENGSQHLFENHAPVSILNYSTSAPKNFIFYKHPTNQNGIVYFKDFENLRIRLSDVLAYVSKPGYNFIPNDVVFELPTKDNEGKLLNKDSAVKYEIKENTSLQNAVELRAYTDFLGLFSDAPNGIVQIEGKGDFYLFPFKTGKFNSDLRILDKVSPYVNFSKIDDDVRAVETVIVGTTNITPANNLDLIQKAYLEMGTKINLINVRFSKETPFRVITYLPIRYQISDIMINDKFKNIKGFALGIGLTAEIKRFNNFGFNYSFEISKYTFKDQNKVETFVSPDAFGVLRNEAEIFYYPGKEKTQSIFLKLKTFNNLSNSEAFYQLQFGYRFSIGISDVKTKTQ